MTKAVVKKAIESSKGKWFSAKFIKKDGSERKMTARIGVKKHLRGGSSTHTNPDYVVVWEPATKQYRTLNLSTLTSFKYQGREWI